MDPRLRNWKRNNLPKLKFHGYADMEMDLHTITPAMSPAGTLFPPVLLIIIVLVLIDLKVYGNILQQLH